jgi:hypothetical protein
MATEFLVALVLQNLYYRDYPKRVEIFTSGYPAPLRRIEKKKTRRLTAAQAAELLDYLTSHRGELWVYWMD